MLSSRTVLLRLVFRALLFLPSRVFSTRFLLLSRLVSLMAVLRSLILLVHMSRSVLLWCVLQFHGRLCLRLRQVEWRVADDGVRR